MNRLDVKNLKIMISMYLQQNFERNNNYDIKTIETKKL